MQSSNRTYDSIVGIVYIECLNAILLKVSAWYFDYSDNRLSKYKWNINKSWLKIKGRIYYFFYNKYFRL